MSIIRVQDVRRSFRSAKKEEGLKASLKLLLRPQYTEHEALKGVSFEIEEGAFVGLIGANGAGKTTLLKILSGLIPASSGAAEVLGENPFHRSLNFRKNISLVMGQKAQLWWDLPAVDAFDLVRAIYEIPRQTYRDRLGHLSQILDVEKLLQTQIRRLSLGERMKMELIGALLHWPKVVFLDEPTIGLDVLAAKKLREFLHEFNRTEKATIILTSHNMEDIERLCPRVLILQEGTLIYDGSPAHLTRDGACELSLQLAESPSIEELAQVASVPAQTIQSLTSEEDGAPQKFLFSVRRDQIIQILQGVMKKFNLRDVGIAEQSLESVIQGLFEAKK